MIDARPKTDDLLGSRFELIPRDSDELAASKFADIEEFETEASVLELSVVLIIILAGMATTFVIGIVVLVLATRV